MQNKQKVIQGIYITVSILLRLQRLQMGFETSFLRFLTLVLPNSLHWLPQHLMFSLLKDLLGWIPWEEALIPALCSCPPHNLGAQTMHAHRIAFQRPHNHPPKCSSREKPCGHSDVTYSKWGFFGLLVCLYFCNVVSFPH